jgi:hypothetical protein
MSEQKMTLIEQLQNPPRIEGGHLDEDKVVDLMRTAAFALSTMIGVASKSACRDKIKPESPDPDWDAWLKPVTDLYGPVMCPQIELIVNHDEE